MSPARALRNTKYDLGENRTHYTSFVGYVALYPLSRKATTHSSSGSSYMIRQSLRGCHEQKRRQEKKRFQNGNDANLEMLSICHESEPKNWSLSGIRVRHARIFMAKKTRVRSLLASQGLHIGYMCSTPQVFTMTDLRRSDTTEFRRCL